MTIQNSKNMIVDIVSYTDEEKIKLRQETLVNEATILLNGEYREISISDIGSKTDKIEYTTEEDLKYRVFVPVANKIRELYEKSIEAGLPLKMPIRIFIENEIEWPSQAISGIVPAGTKFNTIEVTLKVFESVDHSEFI